MSTNVNTYGNLRSSPVWAGDFFSREHVLPVPAKVSAAAFADQGGVPVTVATGGAAQGATSIPVDALALSALANTVVLAQGNVLIPAGATLDFGGAKFARLTADATHGATALTVSALPTALVAGDKASYSPRGTRFIPSGTFVGRTYAERDANTAFGPAAVTDDELFLTVYDIVDANANADAELCRHGSLVKENYLPEWATLSAGTAGVQTLTLAPGTDAGEFRVRNENTGATTAALAWNASAGTVQTALRTLTGDATLTVGLASEVYTVTYTAGFAPPPLEIVNDTTNDGGVAEGGVVVASTVTATGALLARLRTLYRCIKGVD